MAEPQLESMEEYIEKQLEESRKRQLREKAGIEVEIAHTDGCASRAGLACDCGAE
jgi:hypothetical protein